MTGQGWESVLEPLGHLMREEPMSRHTTLGVGGSARWYFQPKDRASTAAAMKAIPAGIAILPLGRGSNLLVSDDGFPGVVLDLSALKDIRIDGLEASAEAGARMGKFSQRCADVGLAGLEFMATVPGDIGGGIAMNAGAFGQQVSDTLQAIDVVHRDGREARVDAHDLTMSYRYTVLPEGSLVLAAHFRLHTDDSEAVRKRMREMRRRRGDTQPLAQPNCGSVFKNPPGDHAARLIEEAGLKGTQVGHARISDKHANFIVNEGGASSADVLALIRRAQGEVEQRFGIHLEPEVRMLMEQTP